MNTVKTKEPKTIVPKTNTTDKTILSIIRNENKELKEENSNKNTMLASTQRDYIAGEVSRDLTQRILLPKKIVDAHKEGILHFHDMDYFIQPIHNCCLVNIKDMLENGTVMNGKLIEEPKSFRVACIIMTQIIAVVASNQYGGQSITIKHLAKYLKVTEDKAYKHYMEMLNDEELATKLAKDIKMKELKDGVQTIRYQLSTLQTTNGQLGCLC